MTPLILFVGFLGAGKTTLLRALIPELRQAGLDPSLILNDFQNAQVDAELFRGVATDVRPISGSCVCCGSREELIDQLESFPHRAKSVMLVEANGTTDTPELVEHLTAHPRLRGYTLPLQIAVVDAKRWQKRFWHNELERLQVRTATHRFLSRRDEVRADRLAEVQAKLATLAPKAVDLAIPEFAVELAALEADVRATPGRESVVFRAVVGGRLGLQPGSPAPLHAHAHVHFASAELELPVGLREDSLRHFLNGLPPEVLRAKGVARFGADWFIFQKVDQSRDVTFVKLSEPPKVSHPVLILVGPDLPMDQIIHSLAEAGGE